MDELEALAAAIEKFVDTVSQDAMSLVLVESQRQDLTFTKDEVDWMDIGIQAGCGMLMQTLNERGWINAEKMTDDLSAEAQR